MIKKILGTLGFSIITIVGLSLIFFPILYKKYSYTKLGIAKINERIIAIYCDKKINVRIDVVTVEEDLRKIENYFALKFNHDYDIYICKNNTESGKLFPLFTTKSSGFAFNGLFVIINYLNMKDSGNTLEGIILHESTHILFSQNTNILNSIKIGYNSNWFNEGTAVYMQGIDNAKFSKMKEAGNYKILYDRKRSNIVAYPRNYKFEYLTYGYIINSLIQSYGRDKILELTDMMLRDLENGDDTFFKVYKKDFSSEIHRISDLIIEPDRR